jgi:putative effector of murein hydrolase LrgA (UPF0299 family)
LNTKELSKRKELKKELDILFIPQVKKVITNYRNYLEAFLNSDLLE